MPHRAAQPQRTHPRVNPALVVVLELEQEPQLRIVTATAEDEARLRLWLASTRTTASLSDLIARALGDDQ